MNYLAHAYLSFNNPKLLVGNMIADYIKGKQIEAFDAEIQKGIRLHRQIDQFTDENGLVKQTKLVFRKSANRYDGAFLDIAFDHFLAQDTTYEPHEGWLQFTLNCYSIIDDYLPLLPSDFAKSYQYMKSENWLYNYRYLWLVKKNFLRFANHLQYLPHKNHSDIYIAFELNYRTIGDTYNEFFPQLQAFCQKLYSQSEDDL